MALGLQLEFKLLVTLETFRFRIMVAAAAATLIIESHVGNMP